VDQVQCREPVRLPLMLRPVVGVRERRVPELVRENVALRAGA